MNAPIFPFCPLLPRAGPRHIGRYPRAHHAPRFCLAEISHNAPSLRWNPSLLHLPPFLHRPLPFFFLFPLLPSLLLFPFFDSDSVALWKGLNHMRHRGFVPSQVVSFRLPEIFSDLLSYGTSSLSPSHSPSASFWERNANCTWLSPNVYLGIFLSIEGIALTVGVVVLLRQVS